MRENKRLEFKLKVSNTFLKTVCAFANFNDGEILFGVDDSGKVCGIENPEATCLDIENRINDSISPKPDFVLTVEEHIIRLHVKKGKYTPYLYKGKAYRRSDTASIEVDQVELRKLVLDASNLNFEELPCGSSELSFNVLEKKLTEILTVKNISSDILKTLGLITNDGEYNNSAALFADTNSFYGIDIARFGNTINEILDRETITNESVLRQYDEAVKAYKRYYQYEKISGMERRTTEEIPEEAFREAIANALVHRDWSVNSHVRISMYKDRIEINSPGGLPRGISADEYLNGEISCLRNPILGNVFFRLHYIEMFGTGIKRIMEAYKTADRKPKFNITDNIISVVLPTLTTLHNISSDEAIIINTLKDSGMLASSELVANTGFSKAKTIRLINTLKEKGYVNSTGNGRGTKYFL